MRTLIHQKYDGRYAYCGEPITLKQMHVDHIAPIYRGWEGKRPARAGSDTIENMNPACKPCNLRKSVLTLEEFRSEIAAQATRLRRDSAAFRLAERFNQVEATGIPVVFWFERQQSAKGGSL